MACDPKEIALIKQGTRLRMRLTGGFTLIEVMVTVFVLSVGVIGAAATHTVALRTRHQSSLMSDAVHLGSSLADSMRANPDQMRLGDAVNPYLRLRYDGAVDGPPPPLERACLQDSACNAAQLASFDIAQLRQALHAGFPGGRVVVCRDQRVWDKARQALAWDCADSPSAPIVIKLGWRAKQQNGRDALDAAGAFAPSVSIVLEGVPG
jgi:type IV pilus assembly protein PilV